jgi:DNA-binding beta-propeller fold protein YncE
MTKTSGIGIRACASNPGLRQVDRALLSRPGVALLGLALLWCAGCAGTPEPIFGAIDPPIVWPPAPEPERIRYVGELRTSADLKPSRSFFQAIGSLITGEAEPEKLYGPRSVVCTGGGRYLSVADPGGRCLHQFDLTDRVYRKISRAGEVRLLSPVSICAGPDGSIYVCDSEAAAIHRFEDASGKWLETLDLPEAVVRPAAVTYAALNRVLYVADVKAHDVKVLGVDGALRRTIGRRGAARGEFNFPTDLHHDGERLWVADTGNQRVQGLNPEGQTVVILGSGRVGDAPGDLAMPKGIAVDGDGNVYVVDARFENVQIFDRDGRLLLFFGSEGTGPGQFWLPAGIGIDPNDRIWISDTYNRRIQVFDYISSRGRSK